MKYPLEAVVYPCKEVGDDTIERCDESEVQFYGLYLRGIDGIEMHVKDFFIKDRAEEMKKSINLAIKSLEAF